MRVLVTHASDFLGFHLVHRLVKEGHQPLAVLHPDPGDGWAMQRAERLPEVDRAEAASPSALATSVTRFRPEVVVYLGFTARDADLSATDAGAHLAEYGELLDVSRQHGVRHLVLGSGASIYGVGDKLPFGAAQPLDRPVSFEGAAQRSAELLSQAFAHKHRFPIAALRFFTVYGPWGRSGQAPLRFARAIAQGQAVTLRDEGQPRRDFVFIDDAVEVMLRAVERAPDATEGAPAFAVHNVGSGSPSPVSQLLALVEQALGATAARVDAPADDPAVADELAHTWADVRDLQHAYGFRPRTPLAEGVRQTVAWLEANAAALT